MFLFFFFKQKTAYEMRISDWSSDVCSSDLHAVSNVVPIVAANRVGIEGGQTFYGTSFITDERGDVLAELDREEEGVITAAIDLDRVKRHRAAFGFFRDRRPELYGRLVEDI